MTIKPNFTNPGIASSREDARREHLMAELVLARIFLRLGDFRRCAGASSRLNPTHLQHLVERYFPNASHQVVVLSTDTEVDRGYYEMLRPALARAYHLDYDEKARMTVGREGYFW